jgi:thiol-disulfide isomerase/thioredoxin
MKHRFIYVILIALSACSGNSNDSKDEISITDIKLKELNDQPIDLTQYEGKTVFINFWATWCKPCIQEMPTIAAAQEKLKNENIIFLFASNEEPDQIESFSKKHAYPFHYVHLENMEALNIQALPTTYVFNPEGKMKFSENGFRNWDDPTNIELITKIVNDHEK